MNTRSINSLGNIQPLLHVAFALAALAMVAACADDSPVDTRSTATTGTAATSATTGSTTASTSSSSVPPAPAQAAEVCGDGDHPSFGAFDLASGASRWSKCSPDELYRTVIGATDEVVLELEAEPGGDQTTIALDVRDGSELWRRSTVRGLGIPPGPIGGQGIAVVETDAEGAPFVVGVDIVTGVERWRIAGGQSPIGQTNELVVLAITEIPTTGLRAVDRATGAERWTNGVTYVDASGNFVQRGSAGLVDDTLAVPTGNQLTGVDLATGAVRWTSPQLDDPVGLDHVAIGSRPRTPPDASPTLTPLPAAIAGIATGDGTALWTAPGQPSEGDLLAAGDHVVVINDSEHRELVALEVTDGAQRWRVPHDSPAQPQVISGQSLVSLWEVDLEVRSTTDGSVIWSASEPLHSPLMSSVGANTTTVFVAVNSLPFGG